MDIVCVTCRRTFKYESNAVGNKSVDLVLDVNFHRLHVREKRVPGYAILLEMAPENNNFDKRKWLQRK